jgi:hypothetical protein
VKGPRKRKGPDPNRPPGRRRPVRGPWEPFGPTDLTQLDAAKAQTAAEKLKVRIEKARLELEKYRRGPDRPAPPHFPGAPDVPPDTTPPHAPYPVRRADALVPFLLIRSYVGDVGARPFGPEVWNNTSPDIVVTEPLPAGAPPEPQVRDRAGFLDPGFAARILQRLPAGPTVDVWVHAWNLGRAPAFGVRVRARAFGSGNNIPMDWFLGGRRVDLGPRDSETSHLLVRIGPWDTPNGAMAGIIATAECITDVMTGSGPYIYQDRHWASKIWGGGIPWAKP